MCLINSMVLFSRLDLERWPQGDFTNNSANAITGTIFTKATFQAADEFDLTGYSLTIKLYDQKSREIFTEDDSAKVQIVSATDGTWRWLPAESDLNFNFIGELKIELDKAGELLTAEGRNGSSILRIRD